MNTTIHCTMQSCLYHVTIYFSLAIYTRFYFSIILREIQTWAKWKCTHAKI